MEQSNKKSKTYLSYLRKQKHISKDQKWILHAQKQLKQWSKKVDKMQKLQKHQKRKKTQKTWNAEAARVQDCYF